MITGTFTVIRQLFEYSPKPDNYPLFKASIRKFHQGYFPLLLPIGISRKFSTFTLMFQQILKKITTISTKNGGELLWVAAGQGITVVLNFVIIKLLAQMGTASYGEYALILTISALVSLLYYGPLVQAFLRFFYTYKGNEYTFVRVVYRFLLYSPVLLGVIIPAALLFPSVFPAAQPGKTFILCFLFIITQKASEFFNNALNIIRKRKENYLLQGAEKLLVTGFLFILLKMNGLSLAGALQVFILVSGVFALVKMVSFHKYSGIPFREGETNPAVRPIINKEILTYSAPFVLWGITGWLQSNGEKWLVAGFLGTADLGIYAVTLNLVTALVIIPYNILSEFAMPIIFAKFADMKNNELTAQGIKNIRMVTFAVAAGAMFSAVVTGFAGKEMIVLLANSSYTNAAYLLPLFCFGTGLFYTGQSLCNLGMALNKPSVYMFPKIAAGLIAVSLNWYFIKLYGIKGTAFATAVTGIIYLALIAAVNRTLILRFYKK